MLATDAGLYTKGVYTRGYEAFVQWGLYKKHLSETKRNLMIYLSTVIRPLRSSRPLTFECAPFFSYCSGSNDGWIYLWVDLMTSGSNDAVDLISR